MYRIFIGGVNGQTPETPGSDENFSTRLIKSGFTVESSPKDAQFAICVDNNGEFRKKVSESNITKNRTILIRNEPTVVCPDNKESRAISRFGLILDMGRPVSKSVNVLPWPQHWPKIPYSLSNKSNRLEKMVLVNGNKISFIPGELYSLRRKAIIRIKDLDFYGTWWGLSLKEKLRHALANVLIAIKGGYFPRYSGANNYFRVYRNWKGAPVDKLVTMSQYKYSLVIENCSEFITEKLFDAFFAGCIPIYVGPKLDGFPIPSNLYFQTEPDLQSILESYAQIQAIDYSVWSGELEKWLNSSEALEYWSSDQVNKRTVSLIQKYCDEEMGLV